MVTNEKLRLDIQHADLGYRPDCPLLTNISLCISSDETYSVLGQNGTGKTTLFRTLLGLLPPLSGTVTLNDKPLAHYSRKELAGIVAYVPQAHHTPFSYTVKEVVLFGRNAHMGFFGNPSKNDRLVVERILKILELTHLADRVYTELSGGERQMVMIARALAQDAKLLILDEPASNLDYGNQARLLKKISALKKEGTGIIMATHQPDHAMMLESKVLMLSSQNIHRYDETSDALQPDILQSIYGVDIEVLATGSSERRFSKVCRPVIDT